MSKKHHCPKCGQFIKKNARHTCGRPPVKDFSVQDKPPHEQQPAAASEEPISSEVVEAAETEAVVEEQVSTEEVIGRAINDVLNHRAELMNKVLMGCFPEDSPLERTIEAVNALGRVVSKLGAAQHDYHTELNRVLPWLIGVVHQQDFRIRKLEIALGMRARTEPAKLILTYQGEIAMTPTQGTLAPPAPGQSVVIVLTAFDDNGNQVSVESGVVPAWQVSDTTNFDLTPAADGLSATVSIPAGASVGATATLAVSCTNSDGTSANGAASLAIVAGTGGSTPGLPSLLILSEQAPPA